MGEIEEGEEDEVGEEEREEERPEKGEREEKGEVAIAKGTRGEKMGEKRRGGGFNRPSS